MSDMIEPTLPVKLLPWDTDFFGFPVARIETGVLTPELSSQITDWCQKEGVRCLYFLADAESAETLRIAQDDGYRLVDVRVEFRHPLRSIAANEGTGAGLKFRKSVPEDLVSLEPIAMESYVDTRFYYDLNFSRERCAELYRIWIHKSVVGDYADFTLVGLVGGAPAGYVTGKMDGDGNGVIGLVGVGKEARGKGLPSALLLEVLRTFKAMGATTVMVPTQVRNVAALRLYLKAGFTIERTRIWFHKWFEE